MNVTQWETLGAKKEAALAKKNVLLVLPAPLLLGENNKNPWARDHPKLAIENA